MVTDFVPTASWSTTFDLGRRFCQHLTIARIDPCAPMSLASVPRLVHYMNELIGGTYHRARSAVARAIASLTPEAAESNGGEREDAGVGGREEGSIEEQQGRSPVPGRPDRAVLEGRQVLELAGNAARDNKKTRIVPRHIQLAVRNDDELTKLLGSVTIASGGVMPNIHNLLLPKKASKASAAAGDDES
ncbi:hypothetical protein B296_00014837 [Ensete ventricosum]|uniref:Histone H2A C-terminal domain-containing protein n=1 Tax=Ensete ventricosum TaxID=4639 RepID=A0A426ZST3_ENSVE|nr:hypothetical protein B296_00014837 [Ensete ventricosum]